MTLGKKGGGLGGGTETEDNGCMRHDGLSGVAVWPAREAVCFLWQGNTSFWSCCGLLCALMCKTDRWPVLSLVFSSSFSFHPFSLVFPLCSYSILALSLIMYLICLDILAHDHFFLPLCISSYTSQKSPETNYF